MRDATKTKQTLQRAALELFVEKGISATTIRDIAARAKIAEGSLYRHYDSKDALARDMFIRNAVKISTDLQVLADESHDLESFLSTMIIYLCQLFDSDPYLFSFVMLSSPKTLQTLDVMEHLPHRILGQALNEAFEKRGQAHRNATLVTSQIIGSICGCASAKLCKVLDKPMAYYADDLVFAAFRILRD